MATGPSEKVQQLMIFRYPGLFRICAVRCESHGGATPSVSSKTKLYSSKDTSSSLHPVRKYGVWRRVEEVFQLQGLGVNKPHTELYLLVSRIASRGTVRENVQLIENGAIDPVFCRPSKREGEESGQ